MAIAEKIRFGSFALFAGLGLLALGGCIDPAARSTFIDPTMGDAVAANKAIHIANPWPRESFDTKLPSDGARSASGLAQYRSGTPLGGKAAASTATQ